MRKTPAGGTTKADSWYIKGGTAETPVSCSFVEFDERGDYLDFNQHLDCQERIRSIDRDGKVLLVIYQHGWKNNSQSGDVVSFNAFLSRLANSSEIRNRGLRVHGVYIGWRGNVVRPYVGKKEAQGGYQLSSKIFGEPIVSKSYHRRFRSSSIFTENLSYWNRKSAAENKVSGLPIARSVFTYAAAAKNYGKSPENRVFVMGHSFGALLLEQSLGQAMTGSLTMQWSGEGRATFFL